MAKSKYTTSYTYASIQTNNEVQLMGYLQAGSTLLKSAAQVAPDITSGTTQTQKQAKALLGEIHLQGTIPFAIYQGDVLAATVDDGRLYTVLAYHVKPKETVFQVAIF